MVNPFFAQKAELDELKKTRQEIQQEYQIRINKLLREQQSTLELIDLQIDAIRNKCVHIDEDGRDAVYSDYDPGGGRSEHTCQICSKRLK
jgi:hypothetical protein